MGLAERLGAALGPDAAVGQRLRELRDPTVPPDPPGDPYGDGDGDADPLEILSFQAQEVAEQLTLTEAVRPHSGPTAPRPQIPMSHCPPIPLSHPIVPPSHSPPPSHCPPIPLSHPIVPPSQ